MSNYPSQLDTDAELPRIDDNLSEIGGLAINALRSAIFALESELGIGASGSAGSLAARIAMSVNADGTLKPTSIQAAGAIVGPITNADVSGTAAIVESKLSLDYSTQSLYNDIQTITTNVNTLLSLQSNQAVDFTKHISGDTPLTTGLNGRHVVSHIDLNAEPSDARDDSYTWPNNVGPRDKNGAARSSNLATFLHQLNGDLVRHQNSDGIGSTTKDQYAHVAKSIKLDTTNLTITPSTVTDLQEFAEFVDGNNFAGLTTHQQDQHSNGISRTCRGGVISTDGYGTNVIPETTVNVYLNESGTMSDNNINGDDVIEFVPSADATFYFDTLFAQVKAGQVITVNYGSFETSHIIDSVRYTYDNATPPNRKYLVRINGRNVESSTSAVARIDKASFSAEEKFGVLAVTGVNNAFNTPGTLLVSDPRGACALGLGFSPSGLNSTHYNLYLELYPNGNPRSKAVFLPAIDVTGNQGKTPGKYTLESVVEATNNAFRNAGFNYRFVAFSYGGEFGIMLADAINGAAFSIRAGIRDTNGNVVGGILVKNVVGIDGIDPLGFGPTGANVASAEFSQSFSNIAQSQTVTKIFSPLKKKNFYVNGIERDALHQITDGYTDANNDHYWQATISSKNIVVGTTVQATYKVNQDLRKWDLRPGKTILVQPELLYSDARYSEIDYGRFIIQSVSYTTCGSVVDCTNIQVYSAVHGAGTAIASTSVNIPVRLYFSDDSVAIDKLNFADASSASAYKRHIEVFVDSKGHTFTHERARFDSTLPAAGFDIVKVSPKLRGYSVGGINSITLRIASYDVNGNYSGYLCQNSTTRVGPTITGKKGTVTRFYDESYIDYIDVIMDLSSTTGVLTNEDLPIQLFPSLVPDQESFLIGTCQANDTTKKVSRIQDVRQFGNISENEFSNSAVDFISAASRFNTKNGVVRGFEYVSTTANRMSFSGGLALVNGKFVETNNFDISVPYVQNWNSGSPVATVTWALCAKPTGQAGLYLVSDDVPGGKVYNPATLANYDLETVTISELLSGSRKDLTVLYFVYANVTNATTISLSKKDARHVPVNAGAVQVLPKAILKVTNSGTPALADAKTTFVANDLTKFTVTHNSTGDVTISWTSNELLPTTGGPTVSICADVDIDRVRAYYTTSGGNPAVRVKTFYSTAPIDVDFVVTLY